MAMKQIFLLIIFQGFLLGYVCSSQIIGHIVPALLGSCVEIPCTHRFQGDLEISDVVWYTGDFNEKKILKVEKPSSVNQENRNRMSLEWAEDNCYLRIDPVRKDDSNMYYSEPPGERQLDDGVYDIVSVHHSIIHLEVKDYPEDLKLSVPEYLLEENATTLRCSVDHACGSSPPSLQWNQRGQIEKRSERNYGESWREVSELTYIPLYVDDGTPIRCTATYPNGQQTEKSAELKIHLAPKFVTVNIIENGKIIEGSDVNLACTSASRPGISTYEWYKGRNRTKLPNTEWKMMVKNVTRDEDLYSCAAINVAGRGESELIEIPVLYVGSSHSFMASNGNIIFLAISGTVCPLLLVLLVCFIWRKRCRKGTSSEAAESPDATYCDLIKKDVESEYEDLKPRNATHIPIA